MSKLQFKTEMFRLASFTLIELLVVMAIIMILASLLFPAMSKAKDMSRQISCTSNLKQIGNAFEMYISDFNNTVPPDAACFKNPFNPASIDVYWINYLNYNYFGVTEYDFSYSKGVFVCPSDNSPVKCQGVAFSYGLNAVAAEYAPAFSKYTRHSEIYMVGDGKHSQLALWADSVAPVYRHRGGLNMLFADGHTCWIKYPLPPYGGYIPPWYGYKP
jgi:prepilin-type processing-associated H-X9-DG protein